MIKLIDEVTNVTIEVPELQDEISTEYLVDCVKNVGVAKHYAIIGLIYKDKLSLVFNTFKGKVNNTMMASVTPILVKTDIEATREFIPGIHIGNPLVIGGADISVGYRVTSKENYLDINKVCNVIANNKQLQKELFKPEYSTICKFVDFKIVPINAIKGFYDVNSKED